MWDFSEYGPKDTVSRSKLDQFFTENGGAGNVLSLVRESLQNALDAKSPNSKVPVMVKIYLGHTSDAQEILNNFNKHVEATKDQTDVLFPEVLPESFPHILIEDYNTTGFSGCFDKDDKEKKGSLVKFWWEEGISEKGIGGGGSHGVGKVTLSSASKSRLFFAHTFREEDDEELFFGFCRLGNHTFKGKNLREYARFGVEQQSGKTFPYTLSKNKDELNKFKKIIGSKRSSYGSSIFIPNIETKDINLKSIYEVVADNFYLPIMKGLLKIEMVNESETVILDRHNFIDEILKQGEKPEITPKIELANFLVSDVPAFNLSPGFHFSEDNKDISEESFSTERFQELKKDYSEFRPVKIKLSINLFPYQSTETQIGFFNIVLQKAKTHQSEDENILFYDVFRGEIKIKGEKLKSNKASAILDVFATTDKGDGNPLSEFFKYCEDPGHTNWNASINRQNESKKYKNTWQKQSVRYLVSRLINLLEDSKDKRITDFANDIFTIPKIKIEEIEFDDDGNSVVVPPIEGSPPLFSINKLDDGFKIQPTKFLRNLTLKDYDKKINVTVSYEVFGTGKNVWKKSGEFDIDLTNEKYSLDSMNNSISDVDKNSFFFSLNNFSEISITGFDTNKNLYIDIRDMQVKRDLMGESL